MLFFLSSEVQDALEVDSPKTGILQGLQALADSRSKGLIELIGERSVLTAVSKCSDLSLQAREVYTRLVGGITQSHALKAKCCVYVNVVVKGPSYAREYVGNQTQINLSLELIGGSARLAHEPKLLCENLEDCYFMKLVGTAYGVKNKNGNKVVFELSGGGGSTIGNEFEEIVKYNNRLCLCIVDGDTKYFGNTKAGETAKNVLDKWVHPATCFSEVMQLECREVENMIPVSVLLATMGHYTHLKDALVNIEKLQGISEGEPWRYFDVKEGMRVFEYVKSTNGTFKTEWAKHYDPPSVVESRYCSSCTHSPGHTPCIKKDDCSSYMALGLGPKVLEETNKDYFKKNTTSEILRQVKSPVDVLWHKVGELVWSWGIAGSRIA